jgi:transglutaminase-like putative cysteine protease
MLADTIDREYLEATETIDCEHPAVREYAFLKTQDAKTPRDKAVALYYAVRDAVFYDPFVKNFNREIFKASTCLASKRSFCIPKAILLAATARSVGIPSRLGFANVTNHLSSPKLLEELRTDVFAFHGFTELFLDGKWVKATPAFNERLCRFYKIQPLDFDGINDSIFHPYSADGKKHMEYLHDHGTFADMPFELMIQTFREIYPHWFETGGTLAGW